jgi:hypothetical protein
MSGQIPRPMGSIALVATLLVWSVSVGALTTTARADDCLAEPNSPAPAGSHWYFHLDRTTQRKCWYIRATDQPAQPAAAQVTSDPASLSPAAPISPEKPAAVPASSPMSISSGDSTPPLPRIKVPAVKPRPAPVTSVATDQSAQQSAQKGTPQGGSASSIREAPAPKASPSSQTSDQGAAHASVATPAWPGPPVVTFKTQEPTAPPSDTRTEFTRPTADTTADTPVSDDAKSTARGGASTTNTSGTTTSASMMPVEMFAIIALGLVVAGILLRVVTKISVMKISAGRRQRSTIDRDDFDRIDDQPEHELHEDQIVHQRDALSEYLQRSNIPAATDSSSRRSSRVGDERPDIVRTRDSASRITNKISMREHRRIDTDPRGSEWNDDRRQRRWNHDQQQHESVSVDAHEPDWIDDRLQQEGRNEQQQHGSVGAADDFLDDLQSSLMAAASEYRPSPSPLQAGDEWTNNGRSKEGTCQTSDEIKEREEVLERLRQDLDRLLQSPKVA